jgi:hypothetical protein
VTAGLAIYDTMQVRCILVRSAASSHGCSVVHCIKNQMYWRIQTPRQHRVMLMLSKHTGTSS